MESITSSPSSNRSPIRARQDDSPSFALDRGMTVQKPVALIMAGNMILCGAAAAVLVGLVLVSVTRVANPMHYLWSALCRTGHEPDIVVMP